MSVYISKNAINNIPLAEDSVRDGNGGKLRNQPLNMDTYLVLLAGNDTINKKLRLNSSGSSIVTLKIALTVIDEIYDEYTIEATQKLNKSEIFDDNLKQAVKRFQSYAGIFSDGVVDSKTLLAIDAKLGRQHIIDNEKKKYLGKIDDNSKVIISSLPGSNGFFNLIIGDHKLLVAANSLSGSVIKKGNSAFKDGNIFLSLDNASLDVLNQNPYILAINKERQAQGISTLKSIGLQKTDVEIKLSNVTLPGSELDNELENTPPFAFDDPSAKIYKIKSGDKISQIVMENYYGGGGYAIMDPYKNEVIYTFPERTPFPADRRGEDARFQFYHNLLYYCNSQKIGDNPAKEWGLTTNSYERYAIDHLDEVNIFDNQPDIDNPELDPALPNYYRFFKKMEKKNLASKMQFDSLGNVTSFPTVTGKNIIIPSRQFADSLYCFLNFRHEEMLKPTIDPHNTSKTIMDYVKDEALDDAIDTLADTIDSIVDLAEEVKTEAVELYHETADFFIAAYNFVINSLIKYWPRGLGGELGGGLGITWGIPVKTKLEKSKSMYRKMTKETDLTLVYSSEFILEVSGEHAEGFSYGIGQYMGHGQSKKSFGAFAGFDASIGLEVTQTTEYEFPIRQNETALLTMVMTVFAGEVLQAASKIFTSLERLNINPKHYVTKMDVKYNLGMDAEIGLVAGSKEEIKKGLHRPSDSKEDSTIQNTNGSHGSTDNIFSYLPSVGIDGDLNINLGAAYSYRATYDEKPFMPGQIGRVFNKIEVDNKYYIDGSLDLDFIDNIIDKLGLKTGSANGTGQVFGDLSFSKNGAMFGTKYEFTRKGPPGSLTTADFDFTNVTDDNIKGTVKYINDRLDKEASFYFGIYSGDVDTLCEPGTEVKYHLHLPTLKDIWLSTTIPILTPLIAVKLFKGIEYHKKVGIFNFDGKKDKISDNSIGDKIIRSLNLGSNGDKEMKMLIQYGKKLLKNTEAGLSLDVKMGIDFTPDTTLLNHLLEFHLKKLYLKYVLYVTNIPERNKVDYNIKVQEEAIKKVLKKYDIENGQKYYEQMYSDIDILSDEHPAIDPPVPPVTPGLLKFINSVIAIEEPKIPASKRSYLVAVTKFLQGIFNTNSYMSNQVPEGTEDTDYGVTAFVDVFSFIAALGGLEVTLESKLHYGFEAEFKGGLFGLVVGGSVDAFVELNYQPVLYQEGKLTFLDDTDPLKNVFDKIENILGKQSRDKRVGAKTLFQALKK